MDEQDLLEDKDFSIRLSLNGRSIKVLSITRTDNLVEIVAEKRIEVLADFLRSDPVEAHFRDFELEMHVIPRTFDIDTRSDQTMTLSFEIVS